MYFTKQTTMPGKAGALLLWALLCFAPSARAEIKLLFENCDAVLAQPDYAPLRKYLDGNAALNAQMCQKLDGNKLYLLTASDGEDNSSNFYYCDLGATPKPGCAVDDKKKSYPNLSLIQQFAGAGGQQYVLWKASVWSGGRALTGYHLYAPAPRARYPRGYVIAPLTSGTGCFEGEAGVCHCDPQGGDNESIIVEDPVVVDEGLPTVRLEFKRTQLVCSTSTSTIRLSGDTAK